MPEEHTLQYYILSRSRLSGTCWTWTKFLDRKGYGQCKPTTLSTTHQAHRLSYLVFIGPIPDGLYVCHNCPGGDNPACVNPDHLFLGTQLDNMQDAKRKGRTASGERSGARRHPEVRNWGDQNGSRKHPERIRRGEEHGLAKLTEETVQEIRHLWASGGQHYAALSRRYGVSSSSIQRVIKRETWGWLP